MSYYNNLYQNRSATFSISNVNLSSLYIIGGEKESIVNPFVTDNDGAVPTSSLSYINSSVSHTKGNILLKHLTHGDLISDNSIKKFIRGVLDE